MSDQPPTHLAYALRIEPGRRKFGRWLEIGTARIDGADKTADVFINRTPVGGWNGYIHLAPVGTSPRDPEPEPPIGRNPDDG